MAKGFSENAKLVYNTVKEAMDAGTPVTAADIAEKTGLGVRQVNGVITGAFQKKSLMVRTPKTVKIGDETKEVKFVTLTDEGKNIDINAVPEE